MDKKSKHKTCVKKKTLNPEFNEVSRAGPRNWGWGWGLGPDRMCGLLCPRTSSTRWSSPLWPPRPWKSQSGTMTSESPTTSSVREKRAGWGLMGGCRGRGVSGREPSPEGACRCVSPPRRRVSGAWGPGRGPEALERLSAAAGRSPGALAHPDQRAAPCRRGPALRLRLSARPLPGTGPVGPEPHLRTSVLHVYTGWTPRPPLPVFFS